MRQEGVSEMVERVARAISGAPFPSAASYRKARAAIEAMAEPTDAMIWAGATASDHPSVYMDGPSELGKRRTQRIYRAALEEALIAGRAALSQGEET